MKPSGSVNVKMGLGRFFMIHFSLSSTDETLYYNVIAGIVAGAVSSAICNPTDVLKVN